MLATSIKSPIGTKGSGTTLQIIKTTAIDIKREIAKRYGMNIGKTEDRAQPRPCRCRARPQEIDRKTTPHPRPRPHCGAQLTRNDMPFAVSALLQGRKVDSRQELLSCPRPIQWPKVENDACRHHIRITKINRTYTVRKVLTQHLKTNFIFDPFLLSYQGGTY
jgi:hypothetical protein